MPAKKKTGAEPNTVEPVDYVALALSLEQPLRDLADSYPSGDNSDAIKWALRSVASGSGDLRKALENNAAVAR